MHPRVSTCPWRSNPRCVGRCCPPMPALASAAHCGSSQLRTVALPMAVAVVVVAMAMSMAVAVPITITMPMVMVVAITMTTALAAHFGAVCDRSGLAIMSAAIMPFPGVFVALPYRALRWKQLWGSVIPCKHKPRRPCQAILHEQYPSRFALLVQHQACSCPVVICPARCH